MRRYLHLLGYALPYWRGWALILVATLAATASTLLQPWPMKVLADNVLGQAPLAASPASAFQYLPGAGSREGLLGWVVFAGVCILLLNSVLDVALTYAWTRVGQGMVYNLARSIFSHLQRRSLIFHSRTTVGDSISRIMGDSWSVHTVVDTLLFAPGHALITTVGLVLVMWHLDASLTVMALAVAPFMAGASFMLGRPIRLAARARRQIESRIQTHVQQMLSGVPIVQAFTQEERQHERFKEFTGSAIKAQQRSTLVRGIYSLGSGLVGALGTAGIVWVGATHVIEGSLSLGSILVFVSYLGSLQIQLRAFTGIYGALQGASAGVDRVMEILEVEEEVKDKVGAPPLPAKCKGHVRLENVTFGYEREDGPVLKGVSVEVMPGERVAIVGPTGAGKSTLVSLVPRFFDPWEGRVTIDGIDVREVQLKSLREQVALVLQEPFLFPISIADNIAYARPTASREQIQKAAVAANAHEFIMQLPQGYDTVLGERGATLSGGERQRISIARALLKDAPILILDEPTSALDAQTEGALMQALDTLMRGRSTLIIAHRLSTIRGADRIVVMKEHTVHEAGTHHQLLRQQGLYAHMHDLQFGKQHQVTRLAG